MFISTEGIVIKNTRYGDSGHIVTLYTQSSGILTFSVRQRGKGAHNALLMPMSMVHVLADLRGSQKIHHPKELRLEYGYRDIPFDPVKAGMLLFFNELLAKVLREEEANPPLYGFIHNALILLDEQTPLHPSYHLSVMIHLTKHLGFFPHNGSWKDGMCFDMGEGTFGPPASIHQGYLDPELSRLINELISIPFEQYQLFRAGRAVRNRLLDALVSFYRLHIEGFGQLKSIPVLRALFD